MAGHAIVTQAAPTSNGTQNYTKTSLGTPIGALFFGSFVTALNTDISHSVISIGATHKSGNGILAMSTSENAQSTTDSDAIQQGDELVRLPTPGANAAQEQCNYNAAVTDGIQVNWVATSVARQITGLLFNEGIANFDVQYKTMSGTGATTVTAGFQPDIVLFFGCGATNEFNIGVCTETFSMYAGGSYASIAMTAAHGGTIPTSAEAFHTDEMIGSIIGGSGVTGNSFTLGNFTSTTFDATKVDGTDALEMCIVSLKLDTGYAAKVGTFAAPTSTGVASVITGLDHTPDLAIFIGTDQTAAAEAGDSGTFFVGACDVDDEFCVGVSCEDFTGTASSDTQSNHHGDSCVYHTDHQGALNSEAAFDSFPSNAVSLNFSTAGRAIIVGYLTIGATAGAANTSIVVPMGPIR